MNSSRKAQSIGSQILLHRQSGEDIANDAYRHVYDDLGIAERLGFMFRYEGSRWLSTNFYRLNNAGKFQAAEIERIESFTRLLTRIVHLFYTNHLYRTNLGDVLLFQLRNLCPGLTRRENDLLRCMLGGLSTKDTAANMGVKLVSVHTYQKRLYRKLGISGQRELISMCFGSGKQHPSTMTC